MKLRALLFIGLIFASACGPSASDVCSQFAQVWCQQQYTCQTGTNLQAIQTKYGADVPTCVKVYEQQNGCANTNQILCPANTSYDTGRGQQCTTEYQALSCNDIQANTNLSDCELASYICH
jgi:hypothetical protein